MANIFLKYAGGHQVLSHPSISKNQSRGSPKAKKKKIAK